MKKEELEIKMGELEKKLDKALADIQALKECVVKEHKSKLGYCR